MRLYHLLPPLSVVSLSKQIIIIIYCYYIGYMHCISSKLLMYTLLLVQKHQKYYREKKKSIIVFTVICIAKLYVKLM